MLEIRRANQRGVANHGWLQSRHTFSFASYFDPEQMGFSDLLVINDDRVAAGKGFGAHPHRDMEIFSYVLEGQLAHKDSLGSGGTIQAGDVQVMSAGTGVVHSEFNPSATHAAHFLQIWLTPAQKGIAPRYQQTHFSAEQKRGRFIPILSPEGRDGSMVINQDATVYAGLIDGTETATVSLADKRYAYVHVARGQVTLNGEVLQAGDGVRIRQESTLNFSQGQDAEVLVFDLRPNELPRH